MTTIDVDGPLIVGGGPVGTIAAIGLARSGIGATLLERGPIEVASEWRGSTVHPPTLEILDRWGVGSGALSGGLRVPVVQYRDVEIDDVVQFDYGRLAGRTRFPFRMQYEQYKMLRDLRDAARSSSSIDVRYGCEVVAVDPGDDDRPASVTTRAGDVFRSHCVIAADGSHSAVRRALQIEMHGTTYPTWSIVIATSIAIESFRPGIAAVSYWSGPDGRISVIRTPDTWRIALSTDDPLDDDASSDTVHPRVDAAMSWIVGEGNWQASSLLQHQAYRSHQRVAATFRSGRVVLVGDAAHLAATTGGMGLNSGIHDAYALVGLLVPVWTSGDEAEALATYALRRRQVAVDSVQPATSANRAAADARELDARRDRLGSLAAVAADPAQHDEFVARASMLDAVDL